MFIFWDNSNIHISGLRVMEQVEPDKPRELFRTNFNNLLQLVKKDRNIEKIYLSGSVPPPSNSVWDYLKTWAFLFNYLIKPQMV